MKNIRVFVSENFQFLEVKFSIYLNRRVFVMLYNRCFQVHDGRIYRNYSGINWLNTNSNQLETWTVLTLYIKYKLA